MFEKNNKGSSGASAFPAGFKITSSKYSAITGFIEHLGQVFLQSAYPDLYNAVWTEPAGIQVSAVSYNGSYADSRPAVGNSKIVFPMSYWNNSGSGDGKPRIAWSDGTNHYIQTIYSGVDLQIYDMCYNGTRFLTRLGTSGSVLYSASGGPTSTQADWSTTSLPSAGVGEPRIGARSSGRTIANTGSSNTNTNIYLSWSNSGTGSWTEVTVPISRDTSYVKYVEQILYTGSEWLVTGYSYNLPATNSTQYLFRSTDDGLTWTEINITGLNLPQYLPFNTSNLKLRLSLIGSTLYMTPSSGNTIFKSTDGGQTWSLVIQLDAGGTGAATPLFQIGTNYYFHIGGGQWYISPDLIKWRKLVLAQPTSNQYAGPSGGFSSHIFVIGGGINSGYISKLNPFTYDTTTSFRLPNVPGDYYKT